jgi:carbamoyltransferase
MNYIGISCGHHDAALAVVDDSGNILYAGHAERYSGVKNTSHLNRAIIDTALSYTTDKYSLHYYEQPGKKWWRRWLAGENPKWSTMNTSGIIGVEAMTLLNPNHEDISFYSHHKSHAAGGFQTSPYKEAAVVVIDAIGEWDCSTIWQAQYVNGVAKYKKMWSQKYPRSIGLFYSAITSRCGLRPGDEEYILMGMAAYGEAKYVDEMRQLLEKNLHRGCADFLPYADIYDLAASAQVLVEELIVDAIERSKRLLDSRNLVYSGGVALNCLANRLLGNYYENIWIMPNPGDAGSSLGAAALGYGGRINFQNCYLGTDISGPYPVNEALEELLTNKIVGVASGRAEWGPRALGNRSLLADPRGNDIKSRVNSIKQRQQFRPFAPAILEEYVHDYFEMPINWDNSRYMQVVGRCKFPALYPAIVHVDNTSRIQTVPKDGSGIRKLLEEWYFQTGCPMLLNTSLNIKNEPIVNNIEDAIRFEKKYEIKVFTTV